MEKVEKPTLTARNGQAEIRRVAEFETYVMWKALPSAIKGRPEEDLRKLGISNPMTLELFKIETQEQFASKYKVRPSTLSDWNNKIVNEGLVFKRLAMWQKDLTPNVMLSLYNTAVRDGKAPEVLAWVKIVDQWSDKTNDEEAATKELKEILEKVNKILPK